MSADQTGPDLTGRDLTGPDRIGAGLGALTWPEVPDGALLVVPTGSCEQHGPHLPLDTDTLIVLALAHALPAGSARTTSHPGPRSAGRTREGRVVVAPAVAIGASGEHESFPGTLSIGTEAMASTVVELVRSALPPPESTLPRPFSAVVVVNAHGGNAEALARAEATLQSEGRPVLIWHARVPGGDPHAGRTETSLMLHLHPELVRLDRVEPGSSARFSEIAGDLRAGGLRTVSPNGVLGDPTGATAAEGAAIFEALLADLVETVRTGGPASS